MKSIKLIVGMAVASGIAAGAVGLGAGTASADTGMAPVPARWGNHDHGWNGPGWGGPPPPPAWGWNPPGTWNGGWEPDGGFCIFAACI
ncbi:hypothetical protein OS122_14365 [Mycolicibacterium mucogenicum]|uniref:hypothetical protein n=1 Tax=Mycolicibacterium mucogenicum TaxID=56689 RepID=UPI00226A9BB5|nr:hypothetical protein [Mycolicibacterium mucogenicum]MCX8562074.1 hypothetical protein [Mycolicibacterium mucogenicum]